MPPPDPESPWWTTSDIAAYLGVATGTVSTYRARGQMPAPDQTVGRTHMWRPARIIEWHNSRAMVRRFGADRYRAVASQRETAFTRDLGTTWDDPDTKLDRRFITTGADDRIADLLDLEPGAQVLERHFTFWAGNQPRQLSRSVLPLELVDGTPIADPANEPWPGGTIAQMASIGVTVTVIEEAIGARMPTGAETETLRIADGVPVLTITRRMLAGDRPVEAAADIVIPADLAELRYRVELEA